MFAVMNTIMVFSSIEQACLKVHEMDGLWCVAFLILIVSSSSAISKNHNIS